MPVQNVGPAGPTVTTPPSPCMLVKVFKLDTSAGDATGFLAGKLPKGAVFAGAYALSTGANATQTINVGITNGGTEFVNAIGTTAVTYAPASTSVGSYIGTQMTADTPVYCKASAQLTAAVYIKLEYYMTQQGNTW